MDMSMPLAIIQLWFHSFIHLKNVHAYSWSGPRWIRNLSQETLGKHTLVGMPGHKRTPRTFISTGMFQDGWRKPEHQGNPHRHTQFFMDSDPGSGSKWGPRSGELWATCLYRHATLQFEFIYRKEFCKSNQEQITCLFLFVCFFLSCSYTCFVETVLTLVG